MKGDTHRSERVPYYVLKLSHACVCIMTLLQYTECRTNRGLRHPSQSFLSQGSTKSRAVFSVFYLADRPHAPPTRPTRLTLSDPIPAVRHSVGPRGREHGIAIMPLKTTWGSGITQPTSKRPWRCSRRISAPWRYTWRANSSLDF